MNRVAERRAQALAFLGGKCARCDTTLELQFMHRSDALKRFDIVGRNLLRPAEELVAELAKCYLVCPQHRRRSKMRWVHGTDYAWSKMKCRCAVCEPLWLAAKERRNAQRRRNSRGRYERGEVACGSRKSYLRGCRCAECRLANAEYSRELRRKRSIASSV